MVFFFLLPVGSRKRRVLISPLYPIDLVLIIIILCSPLHTSFSSFFHSFFSSFFYVNKSFSFFRSKLFMFFSRLSFRIEILPFFSWHRAVTSPNLVFSLEYLAEVPIIFMLGGTVSKLLLGLVIHLSTCMHTFTHTHTHTHTHTY